MRPVKMLGLAAVAAVAAMAFVGATSASAATTTLCTAHTELGCSSAAGYVIMSNSGQGVGTLLTDLVNVLCLIISGEGTPLALADPQQVHIEELSFTNCGTKAAHNNCQVVLIGDLPLANLNKTGLDTGTLTGTEGEILVNCDNIDIFGVDIHCVYDATGLEFSVGAQHLTANEVSIDTTGGSLCPSESFLDGLLTTNVSENASDNRYVLGQGPPETALCKEHKKAACPAGELVKEVHFIADKPRWDFETEGGKKHTVECEKSLMLGDVGNLLPWQRITVTALTWEKCKLDGKEECKEATTVKTNFWDVGLTGLNKGEVVPRSIIKLTCGAAIECKILSNFFIKLWKIEGAAGAFTGSISIENGPVIVEGAVCPKAMGWFATYVSLTKIYVLE